MSNLNNLKTNMRAILAVVYRFFLTPATDSRLAAMRVCTAGVLLLQVFLLRKDLTLLYSSDGWVQGQLNDYFLGEFMPRLSWMTNCLAVLGFTETAAVQAVFLLYCFLLGTLLIGLYPRVVSFLTYLLHYLIVYSTGSLSSYGVDSFAHVLLFYLCIFPTHSHWSLHQSPEQELSAKNRVGLRLLQLHLATIYFVAGIAKSFGDQWWSGEAIWRALTLPEFTQYNVTIIASLSWLALALSLGTLVLEIGYPFFIFFRPTRTPVLIAVISMHLGIFVFMGLHTFAMLLIAWNICAFAGFSSAAVGLRGKAAEAA